MNGLNQLSTQKQELIQNILEKSRDMDPSTRITYFLEVAETAYQNNIIFTKDEVMQIIQQIRAQTSEPARAQIDQIISTMEGITRTLQTSE